MKMGRLLAMLACCVWTVELDAQSSWRAREQPVSWQQVDREPSFTAAFEREQYSTLDATGRLVMAVQVGQQGGMLKEAAAAWELRRGGQPVAEGTAPLSQGMVCIDFGLSSLPPGRYDLSARATAGEQPIGAPVVDWFVLNEAASPTRRGRVPIIVPQGIDASAGVVPLSIGVPFPKGALLDPRHVRLVRADGQSLPCRTEVRSIWGPGGESGIRWLGVDFASGACEPWWPKRVAPALFLEYGPDLDCDASLPDQVIRFEDQPDGLHVDTGPLRFTVRRRGFNLIDDVTLHGRQVLNSGGAHGAYLVDHEGSIYRAANDTDARISVEKAGPLRSVIRVEGWYVKDGTTGQRRHWTLPTDRLCRFVTRLEVYGGQPIIRVLHTTIITYDTFSVRLRDLGMALPTPQWRSAWFGVEDREPLAMPGTGQGVYLLQDRPHRFDVIDDDGKAIADGKHSAGWFATQSDLCVLAISHRNTWQLFPKELEVTPHEMRLHLWPAHGRTHPDIDPLDHAEINRMWFAHQGAEMDLTFPWEYVLRIGKLYDTRPSGGGINPAQMAYRSVQYSALGVGVTSDLLLSFDDALPAAQARCEYFQRNVQPLADPAWTCASGAIGVVHPYDSKTFPVLEEIIEKAGKARWKTLDATDVFGMWTYRCWPDRSHRGHGVWELHRAKNASHHHDAYLPWLLLARSGDPDYFIQAYVNTRFLSDVQVLHHDDPAYPQEHQQMAGAMTHATSITPWSSDAAFTGHQICFVSLITGYYLTGDLRLREVVVEEWQQGLLNRRNDPLYATYFRPPATFSAGRDGNNTLGELIDLYQLTYHPALVPLIDRLLKLAPRAPTNWGIWKENVLGFDGSAWLRDYVTCLADHYRDPDDMPIERALGAPPPPHWNDNHSSAADELAWASLMDRGDDFALRAYFAADPVEWLKTAADMDNLVPGYVWVPVPDRLKILPRVMAALARSPQALQSPWLGAIAQLPVDVKKQWSQAVVLEEIDHAFDVHIAGRIGEGGLHVVVLNPSGAAVARDHFAGQPHLAFHSLTVPADGVTGQYSVFVQVRKNDPKTRDDLYVPFTRDLPEVYLADIYSQFHRGNSFFFTRAAAGKPVRLQVTLQENRAIVMDAQRRSILADWPMDLIIHHLGGRGKRPTLPTDVSVDATGVFFTTYAGYTRLASPDQPMAYSVEPKRWFMPDPSKFDLQPPP